MSIQIRLQRKGKHVYTILFGHQRASERLNFTVRVCSEAPIISMIEIPKEEFIFTKKVKDQWEVTSDSKVTAPPPP